MSRFDDLIGDLIVDGVRPAHLVPRPSDSNVGRPPGLPGYETAGVPILEDDDTGRAA